MIFGNQNRRKFLGNSITAIAGFFAGNSNISDTITSAASATNFTFSSASDGIRRGSLEEIAYDMGWINHRLLARFNPEFYNLAKAKYDCVDSGSDERSNEFSQTDYEWISFIVEGLKSNPYFQQVINNPELAGKAIEWFIPYSQWGYSPQEQQMIRDNMPEIMRICRLSPEEYQQEFEPKIIETPQTVKIQNPLAEFFISHQCRAINFSIDYSNTKRIRITLPKEQNNEPAINTLHSLLTTQFPAAFIKHNQNRLVIYNPPHALKEILKTHLAANKAQGLTL